MTFVTPSYPFRSRKKPLVIFSRLLATILLLLGVIIGIPLSQRHTHIQDYASPLANPALINTLPKTQFHHPLEITHIGVQTVGPSAVKNAAALGYSPAQIKAAYHLPTTGGNGTIAIVDAFNAPDIESDLNAFSSQFGLPPCTKMSGCLTVHYQGANSPGSPPAGTNWDIEISIDVEWAHAIAPNAKILLFEANSDQPNDLLTGVDYARKLPDVRSVSMSWVANEFSNEGSFDSLFTSSHPVSFFAASGDNGSANSWPAVSPNVIAIGGTTLLLNQDNLVVSETAWRGSGGGDSTYVSEPSYQMTFGIPNALGKRGTPDVALSADPNQPYIFVFHNSLGAVGGTSVGTPIWAAMNTLSSSSITNDLLYTNAKSHYSSYYRDITTGTNGSCGYYCSARSGYDYVTGLGSPILLPQNSPQPTASPTTTPKPSVTPSVTQQPTISSSPTGIPSGNTGFQITICPHDLGNCGDNVNPQSGGNTNPQHTSRMVQVSVLNAQNTLVTQNNSVPVVYNSLSGNFTGLADMGTLASGNYLIHIKTPGFLSGKVPGIISVTNGEVITLPSVSLVNGDINSDGQIDITDYNILIACFGSKQHSTSCTNPVTSDLNDDGKVDGIDYNAFIRELSVQHGGN